jgi:hypothetical protein
MLAFTAGFKCRNFLDDEIFGNAADTPAAWRRV